MGSMRPRRTASGMMQQPFFKGNSQNPSFRALLDFDQHRGMKTLTTLIHNPAFDCTAEKRKSQSTFHITQSNRKIRYESTTPFEVSTT